MDVLHLPMDEYVQGGVPDCSPACAMAQVVGSAHLSTARSKYGTMSLRLVGTQGYLDLPQMSVHNFGTGDFCIEFWLYAESGFADTSGILSRKYTTNTGGFEVRTVLKVPRFDFGTSTFSATSPVTIGAWDHWSITRESGIARWFKNGVLDASTALSANISDTAKLTVGASRALQYWMDGYIDDLRISNTARYTADFTPPDAIPYTTPTLTTDVLNGPSTVNPHPPVSAVLQSDVLDNTLDGARALYISGRGRIAATVKEKATPDQPVYRRVRLFRDRDGLMIAETWSNPVTGAYAFEYIDQSYTYSVISYDHTGNFRAVIADNLTPEPM